MDQALVRLSCTVCECVIEGKLFAALKVDSRALLFWVFALCHQRDNRGLWEQGTLWENVSAFASRRRFRPEQHGNAREHYARSESPPRTRV